jgi:hypothetical protein
MFSVYVGVLSGSYLGSELPRPDADEKCEYVMSVGPLEQQCDEQRVRHSDAG